MTVELSGRAENMGFSIATAAGVQPPVTRFIDFTFVNCPLMRVNDTTTVTFYDCRRINIGNEEAISVTAWGNHRLSDFTPRAPTSATVFPGRPTRAAPPSWSTQAPRAGRPTCQHSGWWNVHDHSVRGWRPLRQRDLRPGTCDGVGAAATVTVTGAALGDMVDGLSFSLRPARD